MGFLLSGDDVKMRLVQLMRTSGSLATLAVPNGEHDQHVNEHAFVYHEFRRFFRYPRFTDPRKTFPGMEDHFASACNAMQADLSRPGRKPWSREVREHLTELEWTGLRKATKRPMEKPWTAEQIEKMSIFTRGDVHVHPDGNRSGRSWLKRW